MAPGTPLAGCNFQELKRTERGGRDRPRAGPQTLTVRIPSQFHMQAGDTERRPSEIHTSTRLHLQSSRRGTGLQHHAHDGFLIRSIAYDPRDESGPV